jgi:hypothetical protein
MSPQSAQLCRSASPAKQESAFRFLVIINMSGKRYGFPFVSNFESTLNEFCPLDLQLLKGALIF